MPAALSLLALASCTQAEEPAKDYNPLDEKETVEWPVSISLPDEFRTRGAAEGLVGPDGLYAFSREIDRLWYAVYYNEELLYDSEDASAPETIKTDDGFSVMFKLHQQADPSKVRIFFWAGNAGDNVSVADRTASEGITLNFKNRCVSVDPKYMNGNNTALQEYDSFSGYITLAESKERAEHHQKIVLKRPFAQIHVLSDEFISPGVNMDFPEGVTVVPGFGTDKADSSNYAENLMAPYTWFYDASYSLTPAYRDGEYIYKLNDYEFTNTLSGASPERVTFKEREMDYLGCFYVFAPVQKAPLKYAVSSGNSSTLGKINLAFRKKGAALSASEFASVDIPAEGLQANNRYVIYNHESSAGGPGGPGDGGFITDNFTFEIVADPEWSGTDEFVF